MAIKCSVTQLASAMILGHHITLMSTGRRAPHKRLELRPPVVVELRL